MTYRRYVITDTNEPISTEKDTHKLTKQTICSSKRKGGGNGKIKSSVTIRIQIHIIYIYQKDRPHSKGGVRNTLIFYMGTGSVRD